MSRTGHAYRVQQLRRYQWMNKKAEVSNVHPGRIPRKRYRDGVEGLECSAGRKV